MQLRAELHPGFFLLGISCEYRKTYPWSEAVMHYFYFMIKISTGGKASHVIIFVSISIIRVDVSGKNWQCEDMNYVLWKYLSTWSVASWILFCRYNSEVFSCLLAGLLYQGKKNKVRCTKIQHKTIFHNCNTDKYTYIYKTTLLLLPGGSVQLKVQNILWLHNFQPSF